MKQRFSLLNRDQSEQLEIDFNQLSDFTLTHYVENNQGPLMTDEIIQLLINEARQEGIAVRQFDNDDDDNHAESIDSAQRPADPLSFAPAIDRPFSSTSDSSHIDVRSD